MTDSEDQDFRQQLLDRIRRYSEQLDRVQQQLQEMHHTLLTTQKRLEMACEMFRLEFNEEPPGARPQDESAKELEDLAEQLAVLQARADGAQRIAPTTTRRLRRGGQSWNEAVIDVLREEGKPLHVKEMWERLQTRGFETESQDPLRSLASVLVRLPDVVRTARNTYGLAESVPAEDDRRNEEQGADEARAPQLALDPNAPQHGTLYSQREEVA